MNTLGWKASARIAWRDLSGGFRGLRLLFICLFLGVATLAAIGSLTASITGELSERGQTMLGGDVEIAMTQREAEPEELAAMRETGDLSETIRMRAMAQIADPDAAADGPQAVLSELKGVDNAYPLYGELVLENGTQADALSPDDIVIGQTLADRLQIAPGDPLRYGEATFTIRDIIVDEPDRVGEGFTLGPVAITSIEGLRRTGLIQPGSLYESKYRIRLAPGVDPASTVDDLQERFPSAGWEFKDRDRASPGAFRFFERMGQFLSLIGLTALIIAGIGVGNGVASYLGRKRPGIATLKILGATSADIARIYAVQIGIVTLCAIAVGLAVGALATPLIVTALGDLLPVAPGISVHPIPLVIAAAYGVLIATMFVLPPLARARTEPAAALFRSLVERHNPIGTGTILRIALAGAAIVAIALLSAREPIFSAIVMGATGGVLLFLYALGWGVRALAKRVPRPRSPMLRLAVTNLHRPGSQSPAIVIALGLALTLFVTLAGIQTSLTSEIRTTVPERAPDLFILDIPVAEEARFRQIVDEEANGTELNLVPTLRGTIVEFGGQRVADLEELPEGAWFLRGERGVTYSAVLPEGSELTAGEWWPADYDGPPLISLDREAASVMNVGLGDTIVVSILGREIETEIASLREVNWDTMGFNYIMVMSPNTLRDAPHTLASTLAIESGDEAQLSRAVLGAFPSVSIIEVREIIGQVTTLLGQMATAIIAAAMVSIIAGIAVLIGAIAASNQARSYDSVIMRTLGATKGQIMLTQAIEYALLAAVLAFVALALGLVAGWSVIVLIFEFAWSPDWAVVLGTLAAGTILTLGIGLVSAIPLMSVRPARALRQL
ncbi:MAG: ABC transporter permease [Parasphingopyxis sp.]|uniref:ABC transporter permease n=1 Tax=Parasphingopyxis sp. TaxID=1920299 RepID=UPI003F9F1D40